jgi:hypothetical protein
MRYWLFVSLLLLVLAGCGPAAHRQLAGSGVELEILNQHYLRDIYFDYHSTTRPAPEHLESLQGGDMVRLFDLSVLLHNQGYADSLVALYVSGFDPNLFTLVPLGPYTFRHGNRYCYWDVTVESDSVFRGYLLCPVGDGTFFGGGLIGDGTSLTGGRVDAYNLNIDSLVRNLANELNQEWLVAVANTGLFSDVDISCESSTAARDSLRQERGGWVVGGSSAACRISMGRTELFFNRASRGTLTLAKYGKFLRECQNGCVPVPSPLLPYDYLAGVSERFPMGHMAQVDFGVFMDRGKWPPNLNEHQQLFQVTTCSLYTTYITPVVCIDPTPGLTDGQVCRPGNIQVAPQAAPLRITRVDQVNQGPRVMFTIHVEDQRGGAAFHPGAVDFCAPGSPEQYARELRNMAEVIDARIMGSLARLDCRDGRIPLNNGRGQITCFYDLPPNSLGAAAYQTTLSIEIGYLYREQRTVQSTIHRI